MVLPGINEPVPQPFFQALAYGSIGLATPPFLLTYLCAVSLCFWLIYKSVQIAVRKCCGTKTPYSSKIKCPPHLRKCGGRLLPFLIWVSRKLNVTMFPGLFKEHKDRYKDSSNHTATRVYTVFLDRRVENNLTVLFAFFLFALAIFSSALLVLSRHIPVAISSECLKRDDQLRKLFCYTNGSTWPVDCDMYNYTELDELEFVCYTISVLELGIAIAAVLALAKLATVGITIYIRVSEAVYKWSRGNTRRYCGLSAKHIYRIYLVITIATLYSLANVSSLLIAIIIGTRWAMPEGQQSNLVHLAYCFIPGWLVLFSIPVMCNLGKHCDQEEYISYSQYQLPSCVNDCDVHAESGNDRDKFEEPDCKVKVNRHSKTTVVENVNVDSASFAVLTEQAGRESPNDRDIAHNVANSGLGIDNPTYLTPLLQDHLSAETSP